MPRNCQKQQMANRDNESHPPRAWLAHLGIEPIFPTGVTTNMQPIKMGVNHAAADASAS